MGKSVSSRGMLPIWNSFFFSQVGEKKNPWKWSEMGPLISRVQYNPLWKAIYNSSYSGVIYNPICNDRLGETLYLENGIPGLG